MKINFSDFIKKNNILITIIFFTCLLIFYLLHAPHTVQVLDTGELVMNSFLSRVIHPPGYPLYNWLFHFATNFIPFGTVFLKASLFNICISLLVLYFIFLNLRSVNLLLALLTTLSLATSGIFWKYTVLPDVFILHLFFISSISYFYFKSNKLSSKDVRWLALSISKFKEVCVWV